MTEIPITLTEAGAALRSGSLTSVELTKAALAKAAELDSELGVYLARLDEIALARAEQADAELASGVDLGPLHGIPVGIKDILATSDSPTTANSLILDHAWGEGKDGPVVRRLREGGAVITGKVTTMEFAIGMPDFSKPFPIPRNPWNLETWPGGSSSGTGAGVAAGLFHAGIGTDTGGSIRIPAAFCGVSGLMPTYGRVPKTGCAPLGYSLDHIGPLARSAEDCGAFLQVIAGYDASDIYCSTKPVPDFNADLTGSLEGVTIGVDRVNHSFDTGDPGAAEQYEAALATLTDLGATLVDVTLPYFAETNAALFVTMLSEALAYHMPDLQSRWGDYFAATRKMIAGGVFVSGADYVQAQRVRRVAQKALAELYTEVDLIVTPTASIGSPSYDTLEKREIMEMFGKIFTGYWDVMGNPALVVPMGFTETGLPVSMQLAARPFEEALLVKAGNAYQQETEWHLMIPPLAAGTPAAA
ncbi:MAG TPA: amidase [Gaiellaceae bacterium]|nr:amidase [Gaiellaceae bacterium]